MDRYIVALCLFCAGVALMVPGMNAATDPFPEPPVPPPPTYKPAEPVCDSQGECITDFTPIYQGVTCMSVRGDKPGFCLPAYDLK